VSHPGFVANSEVPLAKERGGAGWLFLLFGPFDQRRLGMRIGDCESRVGFAARASRPPEFRGRDLYCSVRCCLTIVSEERETWAAVSLRGLVVGLGFGVSWGLGRRWEPKRC
jgi:hypothetical protein